MANTHGFEVIAEITRNALKNILKAAWKSGGDSSSVGVIPEYIKIPGPSVPAPVGLGPYTVEEGFCQILRDQLDLDMDVPLNGVKVSLGTIIHLKILNPPIDAAKFFDLSVKFDVRVPIRELDATTHMLGADFTAIPADGVTTTILNGNPLDPIINNGVEEFVHKLYQENKIPHVIDGQPLSFLVFSMKVRVDFFDDLSNPSKKITVQKPDATHIQVNIPCRIRFYDITGSTFGFSLRTPMAVDGTVKMLANYQATDSLITVFTSTATVALENMTPSAGEEGSNYSFNKTAAGAVGVDLENLIKTNFQGVAATQLHLMGDIKINIPTLSQIEAFISGAVRSELLRRKSLEIWKTEDPTGTTTIQNVQPKALSDALSICINGGGGSDANAVTNFVPASRDFAIAISTGKVLEEFEKKEHEQYGQNIPPSKKLDERVEGKEVILNELGLELHNGYISVVGDVTVVDAIADSIDVDAGFEQKVKLHWEDVSGGGQMLKHELDGDPDVSLSAAAWLLSALIGFLTFGIVGLIIALVVIAVVEGVASSIGGSIARDESGKVASIGAWPESLDNIGNVKAHFENPVIIEDSGLVFAGVMIITSVAEDTSLDMARSHGPYQAIGNQFVDLNGGAAKPTSLAKWRTGDGQLFAARSQSYRYGKSGLYIANVEIKVDETGGATTRHYTKVEVKNVAPVVAFDSPVISVVEGDEVELAFSFTDQNWLDKHIAWVDFGDNAAPQNVTVTETNLEPLGKGQGVVKHAWCDNGEYKVTAYVQDDVGGLGTATCQVVVANAPPEIICPKHFYVLKDQPVRLEVFFTDPGWCDTHVATWDCGDGTVKMSTIKEVHKAPKGMGVASIVHIYKCKGNLIAKISVTDDDGATTTASMLVTVLMLENANFENGFRIKGQDRQREAVGLSIVANEWLPFTEPFKNLDPQIKQAPFEAAHFAAEEFINREGQRAQAIKINGSGVSGILQTVSVNLDWEYEFTVHYHLPEISSGQFVIGLDPEGKQDPTSASVVWVFSEADDQWVHASVRTKALADKITCFAGVLQNEGSSILYIDKTALYMIQPLVLRPKPEQPRKDPQQLPPCKATSSDMYDLSEVDRLFEDFTQKRVAIPSEAAGKKSSFALTAESGRQVMNILTKGVGQGLMNRGKELLKKVNPFSK
ncbi:MAG TPA: hypothetical protein VIU12_09015 [Chryseolinea sp.]